MLLYSHIYFLKTHSFITYTSIKQILCVRHCAKYWGLDRAHKPHHSSYREHQPLVAETLLEKNHI